MSKQHWTQTPEGKLKMSEVQKKSWATKRKKLKSKAEKIVVREIKKRKIEVKKTTTIQLNGWLVTLGHNLVKIEQS